MTLRLDASVSLPGFLERGADSVVRDFSTDSLFTPDRVMLGLELVAVIEDIRSAMAGHPLHPREPTPIDRLDLLRRLRRAVLEAWLDDDSELLEAVRAFEEVERALIASSGAPPGDDVGPFARSLLREVGHLLRSPLGSIVLLTETILEERSGTLSAEQRRQVEIVYRAAVSAATSAGNLLTLTSPEEYLEDDRPFFLAETVAVVADMVRPVTEARHSELLVHEVDGGRRQGPAVAVQQALLGMAISAALMTPHGRIEIRTSATSGGMVLFTVAATAGADASLAEASADPLRLFRTSSGSEGYTISPEGLAFNAARTIVRSMGSELDVETSAGQSMLLRYRLCLPLV